MSPLRATTRQVSCHDCGEEMSLTYNFNVNNIQRLERYLSLSPSTNLCPPLAWHNQSMLAILGVNFTLIFYGNWPNIFAHISFTLPPMCGQGTVYLVKAELFDAGPPFSANQRPGVFTNRKPAFRSRAAMCFSPVWISWGVFACGFWGDHLYLSCFNICHMKNIYKVHSV